MYICVMSVAPRAVTKTLDRRATSSKRLAEQHDAGGAEAASSRAAMSSSSSEEEHQQRRGAARRRSSRSEQRAASSEGSSISGSSDALKLPVRLAEHHDGVQAGGCRERAACGIERKCGWNTKRAPGEVAGKLGSVVGRALALRAEVASSSRDEELEELAPGSGGEGFEGWRGWKI